MTIFDFFWSVITSIITLRLCFLCGCIREFIYLPTATKCEQQIDSINVFSISIREYIYEILSSLKTKHKHSPKGLWVRWWKIPLKRVEVNTSTMSKVNTKVYRYTSICTIRNFPLCSPARGVKLFSLKTHSSQYVLQVQFLAKRKMPDRPRTFFTPLAWHF